MQRIHVIDSHTGGEPTRVVVAGFPDLGPGTVADRAVVFGEKFDRYRSAIVNEPRGSDVLVGALLCKPADPTCTAGVIFFNNVGVLGMCGHGTIGLVVTLAHAGQLSPGKHRIETTVGVVTAELHDENAVSVINVPSYRTVANVKIEVAGLGPVVGDVAWGGNWFFLVEEHGQAIEATNVARLTDVASRIRAAVNLQGYPEIDHVELFAPPADRSSSANSRNFVLCPGGAYDRSPCGTGTSAKLACLAASGKLAEGKPWVQDSILGSQFEGRFRWIDQKSGKIEPTIKGSAYVTAESTLLLNDEDPFLLGNYGKTLNAKC